MMRVQRYQITLDSMCERIWEECARQLVERVFTLEECSDLKSGKIQVAEFLELGEVTSELVAVVEGRGVMLRMTIRNDHWAWANIN